MLGGLGRYAAAAAALTPLRRDPDPVVAALAVTTLASHRRQLGSHAVAAALDAAALGGLARSAVPRRPGADPFDARCDGTGAAGAWHDALLGLAADAVGQGRPVQARRLLDAAARCQAGWRAAVRAGWVAAETALAEGCPERAVPAAELAYERARTVGSARHVTKSELVLAAALVAEGTRPGRVRAAALAGQALHASLDRRFLPLAWPSALLLARLRPDRADDHRGSARRALSSVYHGTDGVGRELMLASPWIPVSLLQSGEVVATTE